MNKFFAFFVFLVLLASSCKDPCDDINCNDGVCLDGTCLCDDGFEGVNCERAEREKFLGTWEGDIDCGETLGENEVTLIVAEDPSDPTNVLISLAGFELIDFEPLSGTVAGNRLFITSSTQSFDPFGLGQEIDIIISGDGEFNEDGTVTMNMALAAATFSFNCTGILSPQ